MGPTYEARAQLYADLNWPAESVGYVRGDSTASRNGVYKKTGASGGGAWSRVGDLPTGAVELALLEAETAARKAALDAIDWRATPFFVSRDAAVAASADLPSSLFHIVNREGTALVFRRRNWTQNDPLSSVSPHWGVVLRLDVAAEAEARTNDMAKETAERKSAIAAEVKARKSAIETETQARKNEIAAEKTARENEIAAEKTARQYDDALAINALRETQIPLTNIGGTGDLITADLATSFLTAGITSLPANAHITFRAAAANTAANPKMTIGSTSFNIRGGAGATWPAQGFEAGRDYVLSRAGNVLRVVGGDVTRDVFDAALKELTPQSITVSSDSPARDLNANNWIATPSYYSGSDLRIGNAPAGLPQPLTFDVTVEASASGIVQTWRAPSQTFERRCVDGVWSSWSEIGRGSDIRELQLSKAAQSDLVAAGLTIGQLMAATETLRQNTRYVLTQTGPNLPERPPVDVWPMAEWVTWDDPSAMMGPDDVRFVLPYPGEPDAPDPASWSVYNARDGQSLAIVIHEVENQTPPVTGIDRLIGPTETARPVALSDSKPGTYIVGGLSAGLHPVNIRYRNFVGAGLESLPKAATVDAANILVNLNGPGNIPAIRPDHWVNILDVPNARGFTCDAAGVARPSHTNQMYRFAYRDYFKTNQMARMTIESLDDRAHSGGLDGIGLGVNFNPQTRAVIYALFRRDGVRLFYRPPVGAAQLLAEHNQTWSYPFMPEIKRVGDMVTVGVRLQTVLEHQLSPDHPAAALSDGYPEVYAFVTSGGAVSNTRFRDLVLGHAR
ncbi:hypothetical protein [Paracoccus sp. (in: a-proteobacteria)]|uniref:pyocin knob domain-containing protein n=1 Tax=Paracoccus sp. TaxID=267 RepID=UPI0026E0A49C|nr:hypothetical protein [Paracoccus sp. (in: a-proteobacteria)]MDO5648051.1 hypothetical protein [Paracoccus sp. (in: a-proteobacteria)]